MKLTAYPVELAEANAFVARVHRHHKPVVGHKFSIGAALADEMVGVVIVGRPVARMRDDGITLEVTRLATDGSKNACSFLYGCAARAAFALGYKRIGTYILSSEPGTSLRAAGWRLIGAAGWRLIGAAGWRLIGAAGWRLIGEAGGGTWGRKDRPRIDKHPTQSKLLWESAQ